MEESLDRCFRIQLNSLYIFLVQCNESRIYLYKWRLMFRYKRISIQLLSFSGQYHTFHIVCDESSLDWHPHRRPRLHSHPSIRDKHNQILKEMIFIDSCHTKMITLSHFHNIAGKTKSLNSSSLNFISIFDLLPFPHECSMVTTGSTVDSGRGSTNCNSSPFHDESILWIPYISLNFVIRWSSGIGKRLEEWDENE